MDHAKKIKLKCRYDSEIRVVMLSADALFVQLRKRLSADYNFEVSLKYEDNEGDHITLSSQNDLDDLLQSGLTVINVIVTEALPSLLGRRSAQSKGGGGLLSTPSHAESGAGRDWQKQSGQRTQSPMALANSRYSSSRDQGLPSVPLQSYAGRSIRWKKAEVIGKGAFGVVFLGLDVDTGGLLAVKQMAIEEVSARELSNLENEINLLKNLEHPNIVRYLGTEVNAQYLTIFLEYVPGGSVRALIQKFGALEEPVARSYTRQLLLGLEYLHRSGIAHRDIKGANCLVGNDGVIKLADFGASKHWRTVTTSIPTPAEVDASVRKEKNSDVRGTPQWMAPEVVRADEAGGVNWKKADIWSLGCTAIEMTTGQPPWCHLTNPVTVLYHIACSTALPNFPDHASPELITFLNLCLQRDQQNRPEVPSLLLHPFVANVAMGPSASQPFNMVRPTTVSTMPSGSWVGSGFSGGDGLAFGTGMFEDRGRADRNHSFRHGQERGDNRSDGQSMFGGKQLRPSSSKSLAVAADAESCILVTDMTTGNPIASDIGLLPAGDASMDLDMSASTIDLFDPRGDPLYNSMSYDISIPTRGHLRSVEVDILEHSTDELDDSSSFKSLRSGGESSQETYTYREKKKASKTPAANLPHPIFADGELSPCLSDMDADSIDMEASTPNRHLPRSTRQLSPRVSPRLDPLQDRPIVDMKSSSNKLARKQPLVAARSRADTDPTCSTSDANTSQAKPKEAHCYQTARAKKKLTVDKNAPLVADTKGQDSPLARNAVKNESAAPNRQLSSLSSADGLEKKGMGSPKRRSSKVLPPSAAIPKAPLANVKETDATPRSPGSLNTSGLVGIILDQRRSVSSANNSPYSTADEALPMSGPDKGDISEEDVVADDDKIYAYKEGKGSPYSATPQNRSTPAGNPTLQSSTKLNDDDEFDEIPEEGTAAAVHKRLSSSGNGMSALRDLDTAQELSSDEEFSKDSILQVSPPSGMRSAHGATGANQFQSPHGCLSPNERNRSRVVNRDLTGEFISDSSGNRASTSIPETSTRSRSNSSLSLSTTASQPSLIQVSGAAVQKRKDILPGLSRPKVVRSTSGAHKMHPTSHPMSAATRGGLGTPFENTDLDTSMDLLRVDGASTAIGSSRGGAVSASQPKGATNDPNSGFPAAFGTRSTPKDRHVDVLQPRDFSTLQIQGSDTTAREADTTICESLLMSIAQDGCNPTELAEHRAAITRLRVIPKYNMLLSSSIDGTIRLWGGATDDDRSKVIFDTNDFKSSSANPSSAKKSSAGFEPASNTTSTATRPRVMSTWTDFNFEMVWGACSDGGIRLWQGGQESSSGGKSLRLLKGHEESVTVLEGSDTAGSSNSLVASGSLDRTVRVWDHRLKRPQAFQFRGHTDGILNVRWANGGREIISSSKDKTVKVWDLRSGRMKANLERHFGAVTAVKVVPPVIAQQADALSFVSVGRDSMLHGWSATGDCVGAQAAHRGPVSCISDIRNGLSFGPSSSQGAPVMLSSGADGLTKLWDLRRMKVISEIPTSGSGTASNSVSKIVWIGESFVTATASGSIQLWSHKSMLDNSFGSLSDGLTNRNEWTSQSLGEHSFSCTDLIASDNFLACSSKSGVIFRWK